LAKVARYAASTKAGMKPRMALRTSLGIALAAVLLAALVVVTANNATYLIASGRWIEHTNGVLDQLDVLLSTLNEAEASHRGYALTGAPTFLGPFQDAVASVDGYLRGLQTLLADNPAQQRRLAQARPLIAERIAFMKEVIDARDRGGLEAAAALVGSGRGKGLKDDLRRIMSDMQEAERALLANRTSRFEQSARATLISLALGGALLFIFLGLIWTLLKLDMEQRLRSEETLRLSEEELRTTLRSIGDGVIATDVEGRVTLMNPLAERLTGWTEAEAAGRPSGEVFRIINEHTRTELESPIARVLRDGQITDLANHTLLLSRSGGAAPIADSGAPIRNTAGQVTGAVLVFRDIAEKRRAENEIRRLAAIVSSSEDAIVGEALDGTITAWNAAAERLFGYSAEEVMGRSVDLLEPPDHEDSTAARLIRIRRGDRLQQFDTTRVHKDGHPVAVSVSLSPIYDAQGDIVGASKILRNITERKESELALRSSEERFRLLSDSVPPLVFVSDNAGAVSHFNRRWYEYTGLPEKESLGSEWMKAVHPDDLAASLAKWQVCIATGEPYEADLRYRRRDGLYRWFVARASRIASPSGPIWIGTATDIDDLKTTTAALAAAKESAEEAAQAKDRFLAVLSHELRTPLTPALAVSQLLERRRDLSEEIRRSVALIRRNVELEALLVDDLLDLTKIARGMVELRRQHVDLHELAERVVEICKSDLLARRQHLSLELQAPEHHADADPARLLQVLWNLLKNSVKFTPVGGSIAVRSENPQPGRIRLSVADTGIGIPAGILPRIFEPFERGPRTVSPRVSGLGLGLSISKTLVELHNGMISAESDGEGRGATFTVELAAFIEKAIAPVTKRASDRARRKFAILLVEDHADTAGALAQLLEEEGHRVTLADSIEKAIGAFRASAADLLITDLGLPDGSGHDLLAMLRQIRPVQGIVLSGYGMDADVAKSRAAGFAFHLTKPVQLGKLLRTLDDPALEPAPADSAS
jgi:PAS domain S-box-containing protein